MKKALLLAGLLSGCVNAFSQNFMESYKGPIKFNDIVENYKRNEASAGNQQEEKELKTNTPAKKNPLFESGEKDYHFARWKWYWQQHLDPNGYLVSPMKTWSEWEKMQQKSKAARTSSSTLDAWTFQGPDSSDADGEGVGRINVVAFHPTDVNTYWIGSPGGGAWKTTNNGVSWTCMTDQLPLLSVSDIKFNPRNPNTIYLCTGDKDGDDYFSAGVLKSYDGGATWHNTGMVWPISSMDLANSLLVNPIDTNTLILGTRYGIYISHNGGASWTVTPGTSANNFKQLLYHPTDTNIVYATSHYNDSTSTSGQVFRSADGGTTWSVITSFTDAYRITLAVTPANTDIVEAIVASSDFSNHYGLEGIYKSSDTGNFFTEIYTGGCVGNLLSFDATGSGCGGQGFYDLSIAISPTDSNKVCVGGINSWSSADGGLSWSLISQWSFEVGGVITIHADKHFMGYQPLMPGRFFECNDGGIYWSDNPTSTGVWNDVTNGLGITEFYRVAVSNIATYELAGAQDVGTKSVQFGSYQSVFGGDGMECQLDPLDSNTLYVSSEFGNIVGSIDGATSFISGAIPGSPTGGWITPFVLEPSCNMCILAGYQDVYQSFDQGSSWTDISGPLTPRTLLRVVTALTDPNTVYAADDSSANIFYTNNLGATAWTTITAPYPGAFVSDIKVDQFDATRIWVTFSGYGSPQVATYKPATGWASFKTGLPDVPVNCIMIDTANRIKYVGTDIGVFYRDTAMTSWEPYNAGLPSVRVNDLQINYATGDIWAATYGRSLWVSPKQTAPGYIPPNSIVPLSLDYLTVEPNPSNGNFTVSLGSNIIDKSVTMRLVNNNGQTVWQDNVNVTNGNLLEAKTNGLARGNYILEVEDANSTIGRKKIVIY